MPEPLGYLLLEGGRITAPPLAYTLADAAEAAAVSLNVLRYAIDRGECRRVYTGTAKKTKPIVLHTDLQEWLESLSEQVTK